jgi:hypothetical protein
VDLDLVFQGCNGFGPDPSKLILVLDSQGAWALQEGLLVVMVLVMMMELEVLW